MKVLIIPDVHLKPWMFTEADKIMARQKPDRAICVGDLADDWGCAGFMGASRKETLALCTGLKDRIVAGINDFRREDLWNNDSPIWLRPQREYCNFPIRMYRPRSFLQAVGHSPMRKITQENNLLTCDVFSLCRDRTPYGTQEFCLLDTETWKWDGLLPDRS